MKRVFFLSLSLSWTSAEKKNRDVLVCYQRFLCTGCTRKKRKRNNAALFIIALIFFSVMLLSLIDLILHRIVSSTHQILNLRIRHRKLYTRIPFKSSAWCKRRSSLHKVHLYYALNINFFRRLKEVPHWSWHNYTDTHTHAQHIYTWTTSKCFAGAQTSQVKNEICKDHTLSLSLSLALFSAHRERKFYEYTAPAHTASLCIHVINIRLYQGVHLFTSVYLTQHFSPGRVFSIFARAPTYTFLYVYIYFVACTCTRSEISKKLTLSFFFISSSKCLWFCIAALSIKLGFILRGCRNLVYI